MSVFQRRRNPPSGRANPFLDALESEQRENQNQNTTGPRATNGVPNANGTNGTGQGGTNTTPLPSPVVLARRNTNDNMFPPGGVRNVNAAPNPNSNPIGGGGVQNDSLTLGQLKEAAAVAQPKELVSDFSRARWESKLMFQPKQFDYRYDDTDTLMNELSEFYPYVEMPSIVRNAEAFGESFKGRKST
jgi:hypothetical protein